MADALSVIADGLGRLDNALTAIETRLETEAVEVAVAVAAKLSPALIAREPFAEIAALATECFHHLVSTPLVTVRIAADIHETAKGQIEEIARANGFEAGWPSYPTKASRRVTAVSNGPTAASSATTLQRHLRSMRRSLAI